MPRYIDAVNFGSRLRAVTEESIQKDYNQFLMEETKSETAGLLRAIEILNSQPTADVQEVKHGRWRHSKVEGFPTNRFVCSECEGLVQVSTYRNSCMFKYCPNCGAKMDLEDGEEDATNR